jgi:hypothetical protein
MRRWLDGFSGIGARLRATVEGLWPGSRRVPDVDMPSVGGSVVVHLALILLLAMISHAANSNDRAPELRTEIIDTKLTDFATLESTSTAELEDTGLTPVAGSFAPETSAFLSERYDPNSRSSVPSPTAPVSAPRPPELKADVVEVAGLSLPKPTKLDSTVSILGNGAEHVENVEGAVDRVAVEILRRLEQGPTLVVWAFDASGSLLAERQRLAGYIEKVYEHIEQLDQDQLAQNEGLLTLVVAFGKDRKLMTEHPTNDRAEIVHAIRNVPLDKTGIESSFRTVGEIAQKFGRYKREKQVYRAMTVVVTDEIGDDPELLEPAILAANAVKMPVYVLGSAALYGRKEGYMDYTDPETKETYRGLPVDQGPETAELEGIRLPYWFDGDQYDMIDSGFGPWALSRLAGSTGGIYFITRLGGHRIKFDPDGMREYKPDWVSKDQYMAMLQKNPLRRAVMRAGKVTQQNLPPMPQLTFPSLEDPNFKDVMTRGQAAVARIQYTVDEALGLGAGASGEPTIVTVNQLREREPSRRWQAQYDLVRGRLLAMKVRCMEYNHACARMKKDPPKFTRPKSNAWRMAPDTEVHLKDKEIEMAKEARALLERVMTDHPGTPWALLAQRELKDPLGLKWVETYVAPPPPRRDNDGGNNAPNRPMPRQRPAAPPKI